VKVREARQEAVTRIIVVDRCEPPLCLRARRTRRNKAISRTEIPVRAALRRREISVRAALRREISVRATRCRRETSLQVTSRHGGCARGGMPAETRS
jgi:hypothetical protein